MFEDATIRKHNWKKSYDITQRNQEHLPLDLLIDQQRELDHLEKLEQHLTAGRLKKQTNKIMLT